MNDRPIEEALDPDLRSSLAALERAADQARRMALQTGTMLVIQENGFIVHLDPTSVEPATVIPDQGSG